MKVSVIIPAYNAAATLERAVESCLAQGDVVGEILIVDNNSADRTAEVAATYVDLRPGFVHLIPEARQGSSAARNAGLGLAKFDWVQFLDADDELLPGKIDRQIQLIGPRVDWVMGQWATQSGELLLSAPPLATEPWKGFVYNGGLGNMDSNLFRKSTLRRVGAFDVSLVNGIDMDLYLRLLCSGAGWVQDHAPGAIYHDHAGERLSQKKPARLAVEEFARKVKAVHHLEAYLPEYYATNRAFFQAALLRGIRRVYTFDPARGRLALREHFGIGLQLNGLDTNLLPNYLWLYRLLGFHAVELARHHLRKLKGR